MVKCKDCGFLSLRFSKTRELIEVEDFTRKTGTMPPKGDPVDLWHEGPLCFVQAISFQNEIYLNELERRQEVKSEHIPQAITVAKNPSALDIFRVIDRERECPSFTHWQQGFTPKEHQEMVDRQKLQEREDNWQKFQAQMAEDDRKWREEQEAKAEERHQRELQTIKDINKTQMWVMGGLVTVVIVLVTVISTMLGGAIEAGWIPKWFGMGQPQAEQSSTPTTPNTEEIQPSESPLEDPQSR